MVTKSLGIYMWIVHKCMFSIEGVWFVAILHAISSASFWKMSWNKISEFGASIWADTFAGTVMWTRELSSFSVAPSNAKPK